MESIVKKIKDIQWLGKLITGAIGFLIASIGWIFSIYNNFETTHEELLQGIQTTQQMALKSVIWNEAIPVGERASACDVYIAAGYNSLTKKECAVIIEVAEESGIFTKRMEG